MGLPIPDAPPLGVDDGGADAGFAPGPPVASFCGFVIPGLTFRFNFVLPSLGIPIPFPLPSLVFGLSCDLSNPLNVDVAFPPGGGRKSRTTPDPDIPPA